MDVADVEEVDEPDAVLFDWTEFDELFAGPWLTPITLTVGFTWFTIGFVFTSIVGVDPDDPKTNGIVACVVPFTESTVIFGKPF